MTDYQISSSGSPYPREVSAGEVTLTLTSDQLYLEFSTSLPVPRIKAVLAQYRLLPVDNTSAASEEERDARLSSCRWFRSAGDEDVSSLAAVLRDDDRVQIANPVYRRADLLPAVTGASFANRLLIRFVSRTSELEVEEFIAALGLEVVASAPDPDDGDLYQLRLQSPGTQDVFAVTEESARSPLVRYAGPDWIQLHPASSATTPNDAYFPQQWNLDRIGMPAAWDISRGSSTVVIAIIDSGCDLTHPDLTAKYVPQADWRDVIYGTNIPGDDMNHGTLTAGVAGAEANNAQGVAGVGWDCSIMPIRLWDSANRGRIRSEIDIVNAIRWARTHGAQVINMSWHWDASHINVDIELDTAHNAGLVLVAAAGNCFSNQGCKNAGFVEFPASHRRVIAVGALDQSEQRKQAVTRDDWDSKYGPELSVMAPGVIPLTTGNGGGYVGYYGTSAAAPHVAGLAGLLVALLQNPVNVPPGFQINDLVRYIIEQTATKVGGYAYTATAGHPNGTWHEEMGYGRINAAAALRYARDSYTNYLLERPGWAYAISVQILLGLTGGGGGVVLPPGGGPVPVNIGWEALAPEKRDVLLGLAATQLAEGVAAQEPRQALRQAGAAVIKQAAQRLGRD